MLTVEQFQNPKLNALQTKQNYTDVIRYFTGFIRFLIRQGKLNDDDPEIMAHSFVFLFPSEISYYSIYNKTASANDVFHLQKLLL